MKRSIESPGSSKKHPGPNLLFLTIVYLALLIAGGSTVSAAFHIPLDSAQKAVGFVSDHSWAIKWGSFCELGSAIPLGIFIATSVSRLRFLGVRAAGESIAFMGGIAAVVMLIFSGLCTWSLTRPGIAEESGAVRALQALGFVGGGPGFAVPLGLFLAGVSLSAGLAKLMPRWLMWSGLAIALACELASLTLLNFTAGYFIPVGRFLSILWMIGVALTLTTSIPAPQPAGPQTP